MRFHQNICGSSVTKRENNCDLVALRLHDASYIQQYLLVGQQGKYLNGATAEGPTPCFKEGPASLLHLCDVTAVVWTDDD